MKLWKKDTDSTTEVDMFTVGNDREFDMDLAQYDILGSIAHVMMLAHVHLIPESEAQTLITELRKIYRSVTSGSFSISPESEDIHSEIELLLTRSLGAIGKNIHTARSRNDQVLVDIKMYLRSKLEALVYCIHDLFTQLQQLSEQHKDVLLPGYTHLQLAMPSSFGLWFGAYAESFTDDVTTLVAAYNVCNRNPLGSAAGYGSSFPINRTLTTELLGFEGMNTNVVYAQMSRGKTERIVAMALANVADTLAKLSMDVCLFMSQNYGFVSFPAHLTTDSSIMPHKKNPDVFELIRARCNRIKSLPNEIMMMTTNLPSGYHRDLQLIKEHVFPAFTQLTDCLSMAKLMFTHITVTPPNLSSPLYHHLFSVEEVHKLVGQGVTFRDAYVQVGRDIESGEYAPPSTVNHTHEGSIGNLGTAAIRQHMDTLLHSFPFDTVSQALNTLITPE